jgi:hypothetical protein
MHIPLVSTLICMRGCMKAIVLAILCGFLVVGLSGQNLPVWLWATGAGGSEYDLANKIVTDAEGNSYVTGYFTSTAQFGSTILSSGGATNSDAFVAKLDAAGNWLWAVRAGGTGYDEGTGISLDGSGFCYISGHFRGTAVFGATSLTSAGGSDLFVAKMDANGNWQWAVRAGGSNTDIAYGISTLANGTSYVTGGFRGPAVFGSITVTGSSTSSNVYVARIDAGGNWIWVANAGGSGTDHGMSISTDDSGSCYVTGRFSSYAFFDTIVLASSGSSDIFVARIDSSGNWVWAIGFGGPAGADWSEGVCHDHSGNCIVTGSFSGTVVFGGTSLTSGGSNDVFVAKLSSEGDWLWATNAGGGLEDNGKGIACDPAGNVYVTGYFEVASVFGSTVLSSIGDKDIFVSKLSPAGAWLWAIRAGGTGYEAGCGIWLDTNGDCHVTGYFTPNDASFGPLALISNGYEDVFTAKIHIIDETGTPQAPQNVLVFWDGEGVNLSWDPVTQNTNGQAITPDHYEIWGSDNPSEGFLPLGSTTDTLWTDTSVGLSKRFYQIEAVLE